ncbi:hypothetical protein [Dyella sp. C9]|uniref:hypothetical protein n=1 Tax=Dyella sp. C9 TaxID=2202154 RepID=UPI000DEFEF0E|nr:hypothetical protein [Dyella sp. C9]
MLHQLRWRKSPPNRGRRWLALGIVLVLHALFAWLTWSELRWQLPSRQVQAERSGALLVRLIPRQNSAGRTAAVAAPPPPALPVVAPPPPPPPRPVVRPPPVHEPPARNAMTVSLPPAPAPAATAAAAPTPQLFDASGQPVLPSANTAPAPAGPGYVQRGPQGDSKIMEHGSPVPYKPTRFDKNWSQGGGSSVDDALQHAVDSTTVEHTFHVAPGVRIHCKVSLAALAGGCGGDPPPPPSTKSGDMRLNMAPATALAPGGPEPKPPSVEECIAIYRADKPLPQGCPVDTPTRSVDAEMRERAGQQESQGGN